jgi:hypothetical protein
MGWLGNQKPRRPADMGGARPLGVSLCADWLLMYKVCPSGVTGYWAN